MTLVPTFDDPKPKTVKAICRTRCFLKCHRNLFLNDDTPLPQDERGIEI